VLAAHQTFLFAILFKKKDIMELGLLDENFFMYYEDDDLCKKIRQKNSSVIQVFEAKAKHLHGQSKVKNVLKRIYIRNYHFTYDGLYYYFKINKHHEKYQNLIAYSAINKFLRANKILTPMLYAHNYPKGIIVIEDFGDLSFYKVLLKKKNKFTVYKKLVDLLLKIQKIKPKSKFKNITNGSHIINKYSNKYLFKESDLFFDWYLPLFLNKKKVLEIKIKSKKILSKLYNRLNFSNSYFVHRDYHAQNLMQVGNKIGVIDNQDALIGNPAYDLVSLIDDVRIKTSTKLKNQIYSYYLKKIKLLI